MSTGRDLGGPAEQPLAVLIPTEPRARAMWLRLQPSPDLMFILGATAAVMAERMGLSEADFYARAVVEAVRDDATTDPEVTP